MNVFADQGKLIVVGRWVFTRAEFVRLVPEYTLPPGYTARDYEPGRHHRLWKGQVPEYLDKNWPLGDAIIARAAELKRQASLHQDSANLLNHR